MHTLVKSIGVIALAGGVALAASAPASAQFFPWGGPSYHHHYARPYYGYYPYRPYYYDPGAAIAAGVIGGIASTIAHAAVGGTSHVARCENTYRSYRPSTDTFTGYDGKTYACRL